MSIPDERIMVYMANAAQMDLEWLKEVEKGTTSKRLHEIQRDLKLVNVIAKGLSYMHQKNMLERYE